MKILVANCNHWIGYHLINKLLENDVCVDGIINDVLSEDLLLFFGRNSNFSIVDKEAKGYKKMVIIGSYDERVKAERIWWINPPSDRKNKQEDVLFRSIHTPILFGEWMPMKEEGCYVDEFVPFHSTVFIDQAIHIETFIHWLLKDIESWNSSTESEITIKRGEEREKGKGIIYLKDGPIQPKLTQVKKHFQLFKNLYTYPTNL